MVKLYTGHNGDPTLRCTEFATLSFLDESENTSLTFLRRQEIYSTVCTAVLI